MRRSTLYVLFALVGAIALALVIVAQGAREVSAAAAMAAATTTPTATATHVSAKATIPSTSSVVVAEATPPSHWLVHVEFESRSEINHLGAEYDVWEVHHDEDAPGTGWALVYVTPQESARLRIEGYHFWRVNDDLLPADAQGSLNCGSGSTIEDFPCYRTVDTAYADLAALATNYPDLAEWHDVGDSWEKEMAGDAQGDDLMVLTVTNKQSALPKFRFALMGAIHARELATAETATRFAEMLVKGYGIDPDITWLLDNGEAHILAMANPDGRRKAEQGLCWRKNTNDDSMCPISFSGGPGIDLNRNFSFKWNGCAFGGCSSDNACSQTYRGVSAASEPETDAIQNWLASLYLDNRGPLESDAAPLDTEGLFISLHSYAPLVIYPWGWTDTQSPNAPQLQTLADKFGYTTGYKSCGTGTPGCLYNADGLTDDWLYGERGVASYTIEMGTAFFQACTTYENTMVDDLLATLIYGFKAARRPYMAPAGPEPVQVQVVPEVVVRGDPILLTATLDTTRHDDHGGRPGSDVITPTVVMSASWTVDLPSWQAGSLKVGMSASDGAFDEQVEAVQATVDSGQLDLGTHILLVEGVDENGQSGVTSAAMVRVVETLPPVPTAVPPTQYLPSIQKGGD